MLRAGFLVVLTALSLASGQGLTVNNVRFILKNAGLPDFKSQGTDVFHKALIGILHGSSDDLLSILNKHGARLQGLLVSGEVSEVETYIFYEGQYADTAVCILLRQFASCQTTRIVCILPSLLDTVYRKPGCIDMDFEVLKTFHK